MKTTSFANVAIALAFVATQAYAKPEDAQSKEECELDVVFDDFTYVTNYAWDPETKSCSINLEASCGRKVDYVWYKGQCAYKPKCEAMNKEEGDDWAYDPAINSCFSASYDAIKKLWCDESG